MTRDKRILYTVSAIITAALLGLLFVGGDGGRYLAAVFLVPAALTTLLVIKKRSIYSIHHKQVALLLTVIALLLITVLYLTGLSFGYKLPAVPFSLRNLLRFMLPIAVIIVASELIRAVMLAQQKKVVSILAWAVGVLSELLCSLALTDINSIFALMDLVGMTLFPALVANLLYNYLAARYGPHPNIFYRLLLTLHPFIIPAFPAIPDALLALAKIVIPLLIWWFIALLYEKKPQKAKEARTGKWQIVSIVALSLVATAYMMLISCQFRFGAIVIGTESMTGALNVGDAIVYERYDGQFIEEGDIIVFTRNEQRVIHRVVKIEQINGQTRYYTKGDANNTVDTGFVTEAEIIGVTDFKIAFIGYPTVWINRIFTVGS